jgi:hypothetical protein
MGLSNNGFLKRRFVPSVDGLESRQLPSGTTGLPIATVQADVAGPLTSVSAVAANDVWAVGKTTTTFGLAAPLVERFDGMSWRVVTSAPLPAGDTAATNAVLARASDNVWIVGARFHQTNSGIVTTPLIEHFDGRAWSVVSSPNMSGGTLQAISATSPSDLWAVGTVGGFTSHNLIEHFDGTKWTVVPSPTVSASPTHDSLFAVSADALNDAWAVGTAGRGDTLTGELLRWNGTAWVVTTAAAGMTISGIRALSPTNVWAVGTRLDLTTHSMIASIERFDGKAWTIVSSPAPANSSLRGIAASSAGDIWAVGQVGQSTFAEHFDGTTWTIVPTADPTPPAGDANALLAVTALADGTVVAVGSQSDGVVSHPLILQNRPSSITGMVLSSRRTARHHHGVMSRHVGHVAPASQGQTVWTAARIAGAGVTGLKLATSPSLPGSMLNATAAIASNDLWAVGVVGDPLDNGNTLIEHFDGTSWSVTPSPNLAGGLFGVSGVASTDVWAVGLTIPKGSLFAQPLVEHWDGHSWSVVATPTAPQGAQFRAVTAIAANDVWAVGANGPGTAELVEHFDGTHWSIVTSPTFKATAGLFGVSASSSTDVWAVGETDFLGGAGPNPAPEALHFDGKSWARVAVPAPAKAPVGSGLLSVTAIAPNNAWAVGFGSTGKDPTIKSTALIEHFDGTSWSIVASPVPAGASLSGIAAVSADDIWAVGSMLGTTGVDRTLTLHFDGTKWSVVASPNATPGGNDLFGVAALGQTVVAVGSAAVSPSFGSTVNGLILQK